MLADSIISVIAMAGSRLSEKAWHLLEAVFTALLFGTQAILNAGMFMGIMMIPLLPYVWALLSDPDYARALGFNLYVMVLAKEFWIGRIIALVGVVVLFAALGQLLWSRHKGIELIESGLYSPDCLVNTVSESKMAAARYLPGLGDRVGKWEPLDVAIPYSLAGMAISSFNSITRG